MFRTVSVSGSMAGLGNDNLWSELASVVRRHRHGTVRNKVGKVQGVGTSTSTCEAAQGKPEILYPDLI